MMSLLPAYMSDVWRSYEQAAFEDRAALDLSLLNVSPELCHSSLLPFLAWESGAYISGVDESTARWIIRAAIDAAVYAGTVYAVSSQVSAIYPGADTEEWFDYGGDPYRFRIGITVDGAQGIDNATLVKMEKEAQRRKNVRSTLELIYLDTEQNGALYSTVAMMGGALSEIGPLECWLLDSGVWNDASCWNDDKTWNDGVV